MMTPTDAEVAEFWRVVKWAVVIAGMAYMLFTVRNDPPPPDALASDDEHANLRMAA